MSTTTTSPYGPAYVGYEEIRMQAALSLQVLLFTKRSIPKDPQNFSRKPFAVENLLKTISKQQQLKTKGKINSIEESK